MQFVEGIPRKDNAVFMNNGDIIALTANKMEVIGEVPTGTYWLTRPVRLLIAW